MARCTIATVVALAAGFLTTVGGPAVAQTDIGAAVIAERQVSGSLNGQVRTVAVGSDVFADEVIRTGRDSAARLVFLDETQLMMTANAVVTLDRFVFNPDRTATEAVVRATRGAFRWVSGASPSGAYEIRTPIATIGVRGTVFDLLVEAARVTVVLQEGMIEVCTLARRCVEVVQPGDVVVVTRAGLSGPVPGSANTFDFFEACLQSSNRALCRQAEQEPAQQPIYWLDRNGPGSPGSSSSDGGGSSQGGNRGGGGQGGQSGGNPGGGGQSGANQGGGTPGATGP